MEHTLEVFAGETLIFCSDGKWLYPLFELEDFLATERYEPATLMVKDKIQNARNHHPCQNTVSMHHVILRLMPGGRKKLNDGLMAQGKILLFRHFKDFTEKRKLFN